ncbi:murein transglycosylase A [Thiofilum flexile]|uniref:murein transglycosylase A n=1 Tax=Thiofilum flexile TaxID=125627 RepID=UPI000361C128|nr:MltA domain-containing protein [Thiofilum flexile]
MVTPITKFAKYLSTVLIGMSLVGCDWWSTPPKSDNNTQPKVVTWSDLPGWERDAYEQAWPALLNNCQAMQKRKVTAWLTICQQAQTLNPDRASAKAFFEQHFQPQQIMSSEGKTTGFMTGYYEPLLMASYIADERFKYPIYKTPANLLTIDLGELYPELKDKRVRGRLEGSRVVPYYDRAAIEGDTKPLAGNEILWADNRDDVFFLHIQGSGRAQLPDGSIIGVGYDNQNGRSYLPIGKVLIERKLVEREHMNMFTLRAWLDSHPDQAQEILNQNPSYVFFKLRENVTQGPIGALNVPLVAERSIAVDPKTIPLGTLLWVDSHYPDSKTPLQKLVFAQDTGGAIRGELRADFFYGTGEQAEQWAGRMKQNTQFYQLTPLPIK